MTNQDHSWDIPDDVFSARADALFRSLEIDTEQFVDPLPPDQVRKLGERRGMRRRVGAAVAGVSLMTLPGRGGPQKAEPAAPSPPSR